MVRPMLNQTESASQEPFAQALPGTQIRMYAARKSRLSLPFSSKSSMRVSPASAPGVGSTIPPLTKRITATARKGPYVPQGPLADYVRVEFEEDEPILDMEEEDRSGESERQPVERALVPIPQRCTSSTENLGDAEAENERKGNCAQFKLGQPCLLASGKHRLTGLLFTCGPHSGPSGATAGYAALYSHSASG